jgi:hypothetical protein
MLKARLAEFAGRDGKLEDLLKGSLRYTPNLSPPPFQNQTAHNPYLSSLHSQTTHSPAASFGKSQSQERREASMGSPSYGRALFVTSNQQKNTAAFSF